MKKIEKSFANMQEISKAGFLRYPDEFVVGYGLDYAQRYRNLPFIGVVEPGAGEE